MELWGERCPWAGQTELSALSKREQRIARQHNRNYFNLSWHNNFQLEARRWEKPNFVHIVIPRRSLKGIAEYFRHAFRLPSTDLVAWLGMKYIHVDGSLQPVSWWRYLRRIRVTIDQFRCSICSNPRELSNKCLLEVTKFLLNMISRQLLSFSLKRVDHEALTSPRPRELNRLASLAG